MFAEISKQIKTAFLLLIFFSILTGLLYPALVMGIAQLFFPWRANGSLIILNPPNPFLIKGEKEGFVGSELIGQQFTEPKYFWGRPSATTPYPYNAESSSGSNLGPSNPVLFSAVKNRILILQQTDPSNTQKIPVDLVTSSGSGLDPEISPQAAFYQISRIANARNLSEEKINQLVSNSILPRSFGVLGEPRVNVLQLNIALDNLRIKE